MADWKDNKGSGPWNFTEQPDKWGYLNNPRWSEHQNAQEFCRKANLPLGLDDLHKPCGHWHKPSPELPFPAGKWVAAMQQPGTPYIYVYDIVQKAVIQIDTSEIPVFVSDRLELDSAYDLDYDMGQGNPGAQRGGYCMNKDGTRLWYLFCDQKLHPITRDHPDAQLIEVDISKFRMEIVRKTLFPGLLLADAFPGHNTGRVPDGCSDNTHTYWCTELLAGRIIKIRNSDHVIVDDHYFNYPIECGGGVFDEHIATIDYSSSNNKLYWVYCRDHFGCVPPYNACRHLIRADIDLIADIEEIVCVAGFGAPAWQNMIRIYSGYVLHHRAYYPPNGPLMKRTLDLSKEDIVAGSAIYQWACTKDHVATLLNRPTSGADHATHWSLWDEQPGGNAWVLGKTYHKLAIIQEYLQNILGAKNGKIFTLMHSSSTLHPGYLYCINFSDMEEDSKLDVSYYAGQKYPPGSCDWDWTSVSALNEQTGVIAIFRYNTVTERNYVGCFSAKPSLGFLCDVPLYSMRKMNKRAISAEPISWPLEGFVPPVIPSTDPPVEVIVPPGESPGPGEIPYVPPPPPPDPVEDNVPILQSGFQGYINIGPGETIFYKFDSAVYSCVYPIQVSNTPQSQEPKTVHLLIKRGSKPTIAEFNLTWGMSVSTWDCGSGLWLPVKQPGAENLYWEYNIGATSEFVQIGEPMASHTFYIMLYNNGTRSVRNQRLIVTCYA